MYNLAFLLFFPPFVSETFAWALYLWYE